MPLPVTVKSSYVNSFKSRNDKQIRLQTVGVQTYDTYEKKSDFQTPVDFFLGTDEAYQPGEYQLDPSCIQVKDGKLVIQYPKLIPLGGMKK